MSYRSSGEMPAGAVVLLFFVIMIAFIAFMGWMAGDETGPQNGAGIPDSLKAPPLTKGLDTLNTLNDASREMSSDLARQAEIKEHLEHDKRMEGAARSVFDK